MKKSAKEVTRYEKEAQKLRSSFRNLAKMGESKAIKKHLAAQESESDSSKEAAAQRSKEFALCAALEENIAFIKEQTFLLAALDEAKMFPPSIGFTMSEIERRLDAINQSYQEWRRSERKAKAA